MIFLKELDNGISSGDYSTASGILESIKGFQYKYSENIMPSDDKIKAEVLYNKINVFEKLFIWYFAVGMLYFLFIIVDIFSGFSFVKKFMKYTLLLFKSSIFI